MKAIARKIYDDFCDSDGNGPEPLQSTWLQFEADRGDIELGDSAERLIIAAMTCALENVPAALRYLSTPGGYEGVSYDLDHIQRLVEEHQQSLADERGVPVSWGLAYRHYLAEVQHTFLETLSTIRNELGALNISNKEPEN